MAELVDLVSDIERQANQLNFAAVKELCDQLAAVFRTAPRADMEPLALRAFKSLRRKRLFAMLQATVEVYLRHVDRSPIVRTLYAQALIDQDQLMAGLSVVEEVLRTADAGSRAAEEARGLIGRVYKQAFVRSAEQLPSHAVDALQLAVRAYADAWRNAKHDRLWPWANLVALTARAERLHVPVDAPDPLDVMAHALLAEVERLHDAEVSIARAAEREPQIEPWLAATGFEACLGAARYDDAISWAKRYLSRPDVDAFALGGTARQLKEIWQLHEHDHQLIRAVLPLVEADLLAKTGGQLDAPVLRGVRVDAGEIQSVFGDERFRTFEWLKRALRAADAVGRVETISGEAKGSGFLVRARDIGLDRLGDQQLFLTNRHVVDDPEPQSGVHPGRAAIRFMTHPGGEAIEVERVVWRSDSGDAGLDVCALLLKRPVALTAGQGEHPVALEVGDLGNLKTAPPPPSRVYIVGHPQGQTLQYSLYDNELVERAARYLYYRSPTERGSSGSPLFDRDWRVIGIHHHGNHPEKRANFGSHVEAIRGEAG